MRIKSYLMLVFYSFFGDRWYGSGAISMIVQLVPSYKETYYGVAILLNLSNLAVQAVFY